MLFSLKKHSKFPITFLTIAISFIFILTDSGFGQSDNVMDKNAKVYKMFSDKDMDKNRKNFPDEESILEWFAKYSKDDQSINGGVAYMTHAFKIFAKRAEEMNSTRIRDAIMNFPELDHVHYVAAGKIFALGYYMMDMPGVKDYIIAGLSSEFEVVQKVAVRRLMKYGYDWRELEPIVAKYEMFLYVGNYEVKEAIPFLRKAMTNGSWKGKFNASYALKELGFPDAVSQATEDILRNAPVSNNTHPTIQAISNSLKYAKRNHLTHLARDVYRFGVAGNGEAVSVLISFAEIDSSSEARQLLVRLSEETSNETLKLRITTFLSDLEY